MNSCFFLSCGPISDDTDLRKSFTDNKAIWRQNGG